MLPSENQWYKTLMDAQEASARRKNETLQALKQERDNSASLLSQLQNLKAERDALHSRVFDLRPSDCPLEKHMIDFL